MNFNQPRGKGNLSKSQESRRENTRQRQAWNLSGTGFFIDPAGTLYTAFSVGAETENFTVEWTARPPGARQMMTDHAVASPF